MSSATLDLSESVWHSLLSECAYTYSRSGGPGGQNVNKVNSKVTLHWSPEQSHALSLAQKTKVQQALQGRIHQSGELLIHANTFREQGRNRELCQRKFKQLLSLSLKPTKTRRHTQPTKSAKEKRIQNKKMRGRKKNLRRRPVSDND